MRRMTVALFSHRAKAEPLHKRLKDAGIPAEICGESARIRMWFVSKKDAPMRLVAPGDHFEQAEQLLINWDEKEGALRDAIRCPECRSLRVLYPQFAQSSLLTNLGLGLLAELRLVEREYYCEDCQYTWPKEDTKPHHDRPHMAPNYFIEGMDQANSPGQTQSQPQPEPKRKAA